MPGNENGSDPKAGQKEERPRRRPTGDVIPDQDDPDPRTRADQWEEEVEDRPFVSQVTPEDYPAEDRARSRPDGSA